METFPIPPRRNPARAGCRDARAGRGPRARVRTLVTMAAACVLAGCHDLVGTPPWPAGLQDPTTYDTPAGALQQAHAIPLLLRNVMSNAVRAVGWFSDELSTASGNALDLRSGGGDDLYGALQTLRGNSMLTRAALRVYDPDSTVVRANVYATEAYAEVLLADLYCSGIPLTTIDYKASFTYKSGSSTADVYAHAAALFDTAVTLVGTTPGGGADSIRAFARVGWGRALQGLNLQDSAAHVVATIPTTAAYASHAVLGLHPTDGSSPVFVDQTTTTTENEGTNGLPYRAPDDPRTRAGVTQGYINALPINLYYPLKYADVVEGPSDTTYVVIASGVEARLIEAEAALARNDPSWLTTLNTLRTTGSFTVTGTDTAWAAGTAGVAGLAPLGDPSTASARVDLLFHERAFWLYLTAHRQGDMRRLIRQYGRTPLTLYPVGIVTVGSPGTVTPHTTTARYTNTTVLLVPQSEQNANPLYTGCKNTGA